MQWHIFFADLQAICMYLLFVPFPGDLFGNSNKLSRNGVTSALICTAEQVPIINGRYGDTLGRIDCTVFSLDFVMYHSTLELICLLFYILLVMIISFA